MTLRIQSRDRFHSFRYITVLLHVEITIRGSRDHQKYNHQQQSRTAFGSTERPW